MANPFLVNAAELLRRSGTQKDISITVGLADLDIRDDARFPADAEVTVALRLESMNDGIVVDGEVAVAWHGTCRRCLEPTGGVSVSEVHERYQRLLTDPEAFAIEGDQLDLRSIARELVLLDTPSTPLCREGCAGLCPSCGTNLNEGACGCTAVPADPRWSALDPLRGESRPLHESPE